LRLARHWHDDVDFFEHLPEIEPYLALPSLTTLELMQSAYCGHRFATENYICDPEYVRARHAYAFKLHQAGINLMVLIELHKAYNLIPPYLYGEEIPITDIVYDAEEIGFSHRNAVEKFPDAYPEEAADGAEEHRGIEDPAGLPTPLSKGPDTPAYEPLTDRLSESSISFYKSDTRIILTLLKARFTWNRVPAPMLDEDGEPFEFEMDTDDDDYDEEFMDFEVDDDDMNVVFHELNGQLYVEIYESETEEEDSEDEAEDAAAGGTHDELD
jgi:hypothetical protein